ncbi:MAG: hypothetical protein AABY65_13615 [Nitrospirota bacterium]|jgi:Flp pilus assembly protein TadD
MIARLAKVFAVVLFLASAAPAWGAEEGKPDLFEQAKAAYLKKQFGKSAVLLEKAVAASPKDPRSQYFLGYSYYKTRSFPKSMAAFQKTYDLDPAYSPARK